MSLLRDDSNSLDPLLHALSWSEKNWNKIFDHIVLLEPLVHFCLPKHIEKALKIHVRNSATSTVSLIKVSDSHPIRMRRNYVIAITSYNKEEPEVGLRRQDQEDLFIRNGGKFMFFLRNSTSKQVMERDSMDLLWILKRMESILILK